MLYNLIRKILFKLDPEWVHEKICNNSKLITLFKPLIPDMISSKPINCMGITFKNLLGLAAGLDKNGEFINNLALMGFGYIEIGTVTPKPQVGNKKPRIFRIPEAEAFINRMGFNNQGVDKLIKNVKKAKFKGILGINISKNKDTPIELSKEDFLICMNKIYQYASYIAINLSSPNTPNLRSLQYGEILEDLLKHLKNEQQLLTQRYNKYVPLVIKISPDLSESELVQIADTIVRYNMDGIIATNTTLDHTLVKGLKYCQEIGGLSGVPLQYRSTEVIRILNKELQGHIPIIGVGGINSFLSAREKIAAGATLLQIYSGLIYKGPSLLKEILINL
ncbi:MAG: quinone-dependent dihydroorotate dehydrogenase [Candidatus Dasytiphilus stammeri]